MIIQADARNIPLRDGCVQTVVTSPPYWGLRDYGTARWEGGNESCDHDQRQQPEDGKQATNAGASRDRMKGGSCRWCGSVRIDAQIGLEPTPEAYVATMVGVFREVRRVLRDDGTVWCNLGDSYWNGGAEKQTGVTDLLMVASQSSKPRKECFCSASLRRTSVSSQKTSAASPGG